MGINNLTELALRRLKEKHSTVPEYALPKIKYEDKTANGLTRCIIDFITLSGGQAERINSMGKQLDARTTYTDILGNTRTIGNVQWVYGTGRKGTADISSTIKGKSVKVEVKIGKDRMSKAQQEYKAEIERAGGIYIVAKDFNSFYEWYNVTF